MEFSSTKINDLLKQCKSKQFKNWDKIEKGLKKSRIFVSSSKTTKSKRFFMNELKTDWFMQVSDYSIDIYNLVCNVNGMKKESLEFWQNLRDKFGWENIIQFKNEKMELNIPHLYEKTLENLELRKKMKEHFDSSLNFETENKSEAISKFDKGVHKYIKCLSKRKSDLLKKAQRITIRSVGNDLSPDSEYESSMPFNQDTIESPEQDIFNESPTYTPWEFVMRNENQNIQLNDDPMNENLENDSEMEKKGLFQPSLKQINGQKLEEYKKMHSFINWDEITQQLIQNFQTIDDSSATRKKLIKLLENKWFITQEDIDLSSNTVSYLVRESVKLDTWWQVDNGSAPFADISDKELKINIPKLFQQNKIKKAEVKMKSENLCSEEVPGIIDSVCTKFPERNIDSLLNTYIKRLFKRKNDFVNSIIKEAIPVKEEEIIEPMQQVFCIPIPNYLNNSSELPAGQSLIYIANIQFVILKP